MTFLDTTPELLQNAIPTEYESDRVFHLPSEVTDFFKDGDEYFMKVTIADIGPSFKGQGFKDEETFYRIIENAVKNKAPYLLPPFIDHPVRPFPRPEFPNPRDEVIHINEYNKPYEAGHFIKWEKSRYKGRPAADGYIKVTDPYAQKSIEQGRIPKYGSIHIYRYDTSEQVSSYDNVELLNWCAVTDPAFDSAIVHGTCKGSEEECLNSLKDVHVNTKEYCKQEAVTKLAKANSKMVLQKDNSSINIVPESFSSMSTVQEVAGSPTSAVTGEVGNKALLEIRDASNKQSQDNQNPNTDLKSKEEIESWKQKYAELEKSFKEKEKNEKSTFSFFVNKMIEDRITVEHFNGDEKTRQEVVDKWKNMGWQSLEAIDFALGQAYPRQRILRKDEKAEDFVKLDEEQKKIKEKEKKAKEKESKSSKTDENKIAEYNDGEEEEAEEDDNKEELSSKTDSVRPSDIFRDSSYAPVDFDRINFSLIGVN
jgi:hypothetical protein